MNSERRNCQNCKKVFVIEVEDFDFYKKIEVPPPTWCPQCRLQRRMSFMNERSLYKRICDHCKREFISLFPADSPYTVYCASCFWDKWDPLQYGRDVDFARPFLEQYAELLRDVPRTGQQQVSPTMTNSDYCCICSYLKNCYLIFNSDYDEDCAYGTYVERSKNCFDVTMIDLSESCYGSRNIYKCNRTFFSENCNECIDVAFSKNCIGCSNCFGCVNLRNKNYYIFNQPYTKEEYKKEIAKYNTGSHSTCEAIKKRVDELALMLPKKYMEGLNNLNVQGDYIFNSKNIAKGYEVTGGEDSKFCHFLMIAPTHDSYDYTMWGGNATRMYECMGAGGGSSNVRFCFEVWGSFTDVEYSFELHAGGSNLFGCYATMNKQYCILNKQYSKEEYEALVPKIIEHMKAMPYQDARGRKYGYGEFPASEMSPFAYNESLAYDYFPLTKEEALAQGFKWKDIEIKQHAVAKEAGSLEDDIANVDDSILNEVIGCVHGGTCDEQCSGAFRLIPQEFAFLKMMHLPVPRLCPNCRHHGRLRKRDILASWERDCMCDKAGHFHEGSKCPNSFETSYALGRPDIVYCDQCYAAEVV